MKPSKNRLAAVLGAFLAAMAATLTCAAGSAADVSAGLKPEKGIFRMGIQPWLGDGQWHVADKFDLFRQNGLERVDIINFTEDKDVNAALASGHLDGANMATHTAMGMVAAGLPVKIVMLLNMSETADALIADPSVKTLADLKGKRIAYEEGATSDILLRSALAAAGIDFKDIVAVPMPAAMAGSSLIAGRVPVAVTYEPYLTVAKNQNPGLNMLYSGRDDPGIVSDVFVVREEVLQQRPGQVLALLKSWDAAYRHYQANMQADRAVIATAVGATPEELASAFDGVVFFSVADNKHELGNRFSRETFVSIRDAASKAGLVQKPVEPEQMIDSRFVDAL